MRLNFLTRLGISQKTIESLLINPHQTAQNTNPQANFFDRNFAILKILLHLPFIKLKKPDYEKNTSGFIHYNSIVIFHL
jgi:hypothetical protein